MTTLPPVQKAQPLTWCGTHGEFTEKISPECGGLRQLWDKSGVERERLGYEETITSLKKEKEELKQKIKEAGEQFKRFAFLKGQNWVGLLQSENKEQEKFKEWYLGRHTIRGHKRETNLDWDEVWLEERSVYTFLEMCNFSEELLGLSK